MKVLTTQNEVITKGAGTEHVARIKESPKAFHILSSALYSDKILAVVRELACNARDAHVTVGKGDVPFEIKLPTSWDKTFYVKDFGPGMSEDQIYNLYMTYFDSTKQSTNDEIGQLGLGSKSPFSYGATFTIESRQNGIKKVYTCYKNADLCPAVTKMAEAATDEPDGFTVSLSVKQHDFDSFHRAARFALMYFDPQPVVVGVNNFEPFAVNYTLFGSNWKAAEDSVYSGFRVVQGPVSYPVDVQVVVDTIRHKDAALADALVELDRMNRNGRFSTTPCIDMFMDIGSVEVAPSREALTYDLRTSMNVAKAMMDVSTELVEEIQREVSNSPSRWDAACKIGELTRSRNSVIERAATLCVQNSTLQYNGEPIDHQNFFFGVTSEDIMGKDRSKYNNKYTWPTIVTYDLKRIRRGVSMNCVSHWAESSFIADVADALPGGLMKNCGAAPYRNTFFVLVDVKYSHSKKDRVLKNFLSNQQDINHRTPSAVVIEPIEFGKNLDKLQRVLDMYGNPPVINLSSLEVPASSYTKYKAKKTNEVLMLDLDYVPDDRYSSRSTKYSKKFWVDAVVDFDNGGVYVPVDRFTITSSPTSADSIIRYVNWAKELDIIDDDAEVYGLNPARLSAAKSSKGNWVNLFTLVEDFLIANVPDVIQATTDSILMKSVAECQLSPLFENWNPVWDNIDSEPLKELKKLWDANVAANKGVTTRDTDRDFTILSLFNHGVGHHSKITDAAGNKLRVVSVYDARSILHRTLIEPVLQAFPLLECIRLDYVFRHNGGVELVSKAFSV